MVKVFLEGTDDRANLAGVDNTPGRAASAHSPCPRPSDASVSLGTSGHGIQ